MGRRALHYCSPLKNFPHHILRTQMSHTSVLSYPSFCDELEEHETENKSANTWNSNKWRNTVKLKKMLKMTCFTFPIKLNYPLHLNLNPELILPYFTLLNLFVFRGTESQKFKWTHIRLTVEDGKHFRLNKHHPNWNPNEDRTVLISFLFF